MSQEWNQYITNLQRRFDKDMDGPIIINGVFATVNNPASLTKIFVQDVPHAGLVITGNCDHAIYRLSRGNNQTPTQYWADLRDIDADYLSKKITTGEAREWYLEKYKSVFQQHFSSMGEQFVRDHTDGVEFYEDAADRWRHSHHIFYENSVWDMGLAPSIKVYMHAAALRAIGRKAYKELERRERCAKSP